MYPPKFDYHRASSLDEAFSLMSQTGGKVLAGGHSMIPTLKLRLADPGALIDIGRISDLNGISVSGGSIHIGALTTHATVAASSNLPAALTEAAGWIGDPQVRNRGTVGGNVAHADPASDLPTVFVALGATVHVQGPNGSRSIPAENFFIDLFMTDLRDDELVTSVEVPQDGTSTAYAKLFNPASRYAIVGAAVKIDISGNSFNTARVAIGGLTPNAVRSKSVEDALVNEPVSDATIEAAAAKVTADLVDVMGDIHASEEYRRAMAPVFVERAIKSAVERS
ncbi:MAG: xanthine dehydrogenase family protein subunit M [Chloroflexota bacterium]